MLFVLKKCLIVSIFVVMVLFTRHILLFFFLLMTGHPLLAQKTGINPKDSLSDKDYEYFKKQIEGSANDSVKLHCYLNSFIKKARIEHNLKEAYYYYNFYLFYSSENKQITHADSAIYFAKKLKADALIGDAYYSKGVVYFFRKQYKEALDNDLIASSYIQKTNDEYLKHKIKYSIANIKSYLGFYEEAVALFEECILFFSKTKDYNNQKGYLKSLNGLAKSYSSLGKYALSSKTIAIGVEVAKKQKFELDVHYFLKTEGVNEYFKKNYSLAFQKLDEALPSVLKNDDIPTATAIYFYFGKCYLELDEQKKAIKYFLKVDKTLDDNSFITPELRENYEILIAYYKEKNDLAKQLEYVNKLLKADLTLNQNYKYLLGKMHKEYDTKSLNEAKIALENKLLNQQSKFGFYGIMAIVLTIGLSALLFFYYKKNQTYRKRFEALMEQSKEKKENKPVVNPPLKTIGIKQEIVEDLLKKLDFFEKENKFLQKGLTMVLLVEQFKTNSTYLSKVINHYKDKSFSNYVNKLRIEYAINLLKTERITQKYSIKALSEMTGFSTTQHFSDAFQLHTGLKPTYFIEQLQKSQLRVV